MGSTGNNNQRLMPIQNMSMAHNQRPFVQQIPRQSYQPGSQTLSLGVVNRPLENETVQSQKMGHNNVIYRKINQAQVE